MPVTCPCESLRPSIKGALEFKQVLLLSIIYLSVNLPTPRDTENPKLGRGRANNVLRHSLEMVVKEEQISMRRKGGDCSKLQAALEKTVRPVLPRRVSPNLLQQRMAPPNTVIITRGNPWSIDDIKYIADSNQMRFEKEDW